MNKKTVFLSLLIALAVAPTIQGKTLFSWNYQGSLRNFLPSLATKIRTWLFTPQTTQQTAVTTNPQKHHFKQGLFFDNTNPAAFTPHEKVYKKPATQETPQKQNLFLRALQWTKNKLKSVGEWAKNKYSKDLKARRDYYDAEKDLVSFIKKMRKTNGIIFKNEAPETVTLSLVTQNETNEKQEEQTITLAPDEFYIFEQEPTTFLSGMKLEGNSYHLNPKMTIDGHIQLTVQTTQDRFFLHQFHDFAFESKPFTQEQLNDPNQTEEQKTFKQQFNGHIQYVKQIFAPQEGLTLEGIDKQRQTLFAKNNIASILKKDPEALDRHENRIPLITHKIWVTSDSNPIDLPDYYLEWYKNSTEHNPVADGWTHFLWIENKEKLPNLVKKLEGHPNIKIMELDKDFPIDLYTGDLYKQAIKNKQFGKASDILRLEILRQFGGYYLDTDYEVFQSLKPYSKVYDMVVAVEPMSALLCNAFIGARPDHPVINKGLELITRNIINQKTDAPDYIRNNTDTGWKTIVETGPAMLTAAFALAAGQGDEVDIAMPPMLIYPTPVNEYPKKEVVKPNKTIPAEAVGAHYWETAWMRKEFGSKG